MDSFVNKTGLHNLMQRELFETILRLKSFVHIITDDFR